MVHSSSKYGIKDSKDHATDLVSGGYFFTMRSCEFAKAAKKGRTKMICLGGIKFYDKKHWEINHWDPKLIQKARFVWILFEEQKKRKQMNPGHKKHQATSIFDAYEPLLVPFNKYSGLLGMQTNILPSAPSIAVLCTDQIIFQTHIPSRYFMMRAAKAEVNLPLDSNRQILATKASDLEQQLVCSS